MSPSDDTPQTQQPRMAGWHFHPVLPLKISPYFILPVRLTEMLRWLVRSWLPLTERLLFLGLAILSWVYLTPALELCVTISASWIVPIYLKNLGLMLLIAGGLHLYLYRFKGQGRSLKFDNSMANKDGQKFTFGNQVRDNIFWSLASGVTVWTATECTLLWLHANGYAASMSYADNPLWFIGLFMLVPVWNSSWFFVIHRALHWPPLYKLAHHVHHRNVSVGPWSGNAMHPIEHVIWLSGVFIYAFVFCNPLHIIFSQHLSILGAVVSHSGYEGLVIGQKRRMKMGDFFHQLHHRYYDCNYGTAEVPLDKWHGSFHDGTAEGAKVLKR